MNPCLYIVGYILGPMFLFVVNFGNMETNMKCCVIHVKVFLCPKLPNQSRNLKLLYSPRGLSLFIYTEYILMSPNIFFLGQFLPFGKMFLKKTFLLLFKIICQNLNLKKKITMFLHILQTNSKDIQRF
jgi:hypothetical protein